MLGQLEEVASGRKDTRECREVGRQEKGTLRGSCEDRCGFFQVSLVLDYLYSKTRKAVRNIFVLEILVQLSVFCHGEEYPRW